MTPSQSTEQWNQTRAEQQIHSEQLKRVELFNGRAAMVGIAHQIGLGALVDGYAACSTQFLPFCF